MERALILITLAVNTFFAAAAGATLRIPVRRAVKGERTRSVLKDSTAMRTSLAWGRPSLLIMLLSQAMIFLNIAERTKQTLQIPVGSRVEMMMIAASDKRVIRV